MNKILYFTAAALLSSLVLASAPASARNGHGFLADIGVATGVISPSQADTLDGIHGAIGAPLNNLNPMQGGGINAAPPVMQPPVMQPPVRMGQICVTQVGQFFGPPNPVGSFCTATTPWGVVQGRVF